jgi:putative hydrolase of the HAD superfamily
MKNHNRQNELFDYKSVKVIAFDADDTLWVNEPFFRDTETEFCNLFTSIMPAVEVSAELYKTEMANLSLYGYGAKSFMLSMIETAFRIAGHIRAGEMIETIISLGKNQLNKPVELLTGVSTTLSSLLASYRLVVATKGDLLDQQRKLSKSGLEPFFHHIEIMSDKQPSDYLKLIKHLDIKPQEFLMIGNSVKSDILPVISIGGKAIHVPFHITWSHEKIDGAAIQADFESVENITDVLKFLETDENN